ncbi:MAG: CPBP family intramembrane glutamic endopeptidase, partial [Terracidiphilus sp.]
TPPPALSAPEAYGPHDSGAPEPPAAPRGIMPRVFVGPHGLRAGWSILVFALLMIGFTFLTGSILSRAGHLDRKQGFTPFAAFLGELAPFIAMLGAAAIVAVLERRRILDYNLVDAHGPRHFLSGLAAGFLALSALVGALAAGGWLHFGPIALSGAAILQNAALWGAAFLLVGCVEEGMFRCYLQFTLTRAINFWIAVAILGAVCLDLILRTKGNGAWGVYLMALLGLVPCYILHQRKAASAGFWQAAWVSSALFGFLHTGNNGENWIGIFAAAAIGFVFCASIYLTGSAWWAIGCHAAWDWSETFFYGTADSGLAASGHFLTTAPAGKAFWSGGADGPEGSALVLAVILALLGALFLLYPRPRQSVPAQLVAAEPAQ